MKNKPELYEDLFFVWELFQELNAGRSYGFTANALTTDSIMAVFNLHHVPQNERLELFHLIQALDGCWLKSYETKSKENRKRK